AARPGQALLDRDASAPRSVGSQGHVACGAGEVVPRALGDDEELVRGVVRASASGADRRAGLAVERPGRSVAAGVRGLAHRQLIAVLPLVAALQARLAELVGPDADL